MTGAVAGQLVTRDLAARATVYLEARTHYGIVEPATLDPLRAVWRAVLGERDLRALDDLYARLVWIPDGELERLDEAAREYRRIVGEPDPPPSAGGAGKPGGSAPAGSDGHARPDHGEHSGGGTAPGSLADALEQAIATARAGQLKQLDEDPRDPARKSADVVRWTPKTTMTTTPEPMDKLDAAATAAVSGPADDPLPVERIVGPCVIRPDGPARAGCGESR
jgi:hypothetical protein